MAARVLSALRRRTHSWHRQAGFRPSFPEIAGTGAQPLLDAIPLLQLRGGRGGEAPGKAAGGKMPNRRRQEGRLVRPAPSRGPSRGLVEDQGGPGPRLHLVAREELRDGYGIEAGVAGPFQEGRMKSSFINYVDVRTLQNPWVEVCGDNAWTGIEMSPPRFLEGVKRKFSTSILCDIVRNA